MSRLYWAIGTGIVLLSFLATAVLYPQLPVRIPTHWNIRGEVDAYGPKTWAAFLMPAVALGMLGLFAALPWLSPRPFVVDSFRATYLFIMVLTIGLLTYIHALTLLAALRMVVDFPRAMMGGLFLFFALLGNVLGKVRRNFYVGVRVPWTLASDRVWNDTHRLAAWLFVACGVAGFLITMAGYLLAALPLLALAVVVPVVYSFVHYKRLEARGQV